MIFLFNFNRFYFGEMCKWISDDYLRSLEIYRKYDWSEAAINSKSIQSSCLHDIPDEYLSSWPSDIILELFDFAISNANIWGLSYGHFKSFMRYHKLTSIDCKDIYVYRHIFQFLFANSSLTDRAFININYSCKSV